MEKFLLIYAPVAFFLHLFKALDHWDVTRQGDPLPFRFYLSACCAAAWAVVFAKLAGGG